MLQPLPLVYDLSCIQAPTLTSAYTVHSDKFTSLDFNLTSHQSTSYHTLFHTYFIPGLLQAVTHAQRSSLRRIP